MPRASALLGHCCHHWSDCWAQARLSVTDAARPVLEYTRMAVRCNMRAICHRVLDFSTPGSMKYRNPYAFRRLSCTCHPLNMGKRASQDPTPVDCSVAAARTRTQDPETAASQLTAFGIHGQSGTPGSPICILSASLARGLQNFHQHPAAVDEREFSPW